MPPFFFAHFLQAVIDPLNKILSFSSNTPHQFALIQFIAHSPRRLLLSHLLRQSGTRDTSHSQPVGDRSGLSC